MFWTKAGGTGGQIQSPEDFVVNEIISRKFLAAYERTGSGVRRITGPYTLFLLAKRDMTTHKAISVIADRFSIDRKSIGYAGLKDKFAVTTQHVTIRGVDQELEGDDLTLTRMAKTNRHIGVGDLDGNEFIITLHGAKRENLPAAIKEIENRGLPNYFGPQRFGSAGNNHEIGRLLLKREFGAALEAINSMYGKNYTDIMHVKKEKLKFFLHAYQARVFNEALAACADTNEPLFAAVALAGYGTKWKKMIMDKNSARVLEKDGVRLEDFRIRELRLAARGGFRDAFIKAGNIRYKMHDNSVELQFTLQKGSYATVLLREIIK